MRKSIRLGGGSAGSFHRNPTQASANVELPTYGYSQRDEAQPSSNPSQNIQSPSVYAPNVYAPNTQNIIPSANNIHVQLGVQLGSQAISAGHQYVSTQVAVKSSLD